MPIPTVSYAARSVFLKRLGFRNYKLYLKSDLWKDIRDRLCRSWRKSLGGMQIYCYAGCGRPYTEWHHRTYSESTLSGEKASRYVVPLCRLCHKGIEYKDRIKRSPQEVDDELARLRALRRAYWTNEGNPGLCPLASASQREAPKKPLARQISLCPGF